MARLSEYINKSWVLYFGNRINKSEANAVALAALHPMDADPDDKLTFAVGFGTYHSEKSLALGASGNHWKTITSDWRITSSSESTDVQNKFLIQYVC